MFTEATFSGFYFLWHGILFNKTVSFNYFHNTFAFSSHPGLVRWWVVILLHFIIVVALKGFNNIYMYNFTNPWNTNPRPKPSQANLTFSISYSSMYSCLSWSDRSRHIWPMIFPISHNFKSGCVAFTESHTYKDRTSAIIILCIIHAWF